MKQFEKDIQKSIQILEQNISELKREINIVGNYDTILAGNMKNYLDQVDHDQTEYLKISLLDIQEGEASITKLINQIEKNRIQYLADFMQSSTDYIRKKLLSPFWFNINASTVDIIDELAKLPFGEEYLQANNSEKLGMLNNGLKKFEDFIQKYKREKDVVKFRLPMKVIIWGLPIWIGVLISGKSNFLINTISFICLMIIAALTYYVVNKRKITKIELSTSSNTNKNGKLGSFFNSSVMLYIQLLVAILIALSTLFFQSKEYIAKYLSGDPLSFQYKDSVKTFAGDSVRIPVSFSSKDEDLYKVSIHITSAIVTGNSYLSIPILNKQIVNREMLLDIPQNIPSGIYPYQLVIEYTMNSNVKFIYDGYLERRKEYEIFVLVNNNKIK